MPKGTKHEMKSFGLEGGGGGGNSEASVFRKPGSWTPASRAFSLHTGFQMLLGLSGDVATGPSHFHTGSLHGRPPGKGPQSSLCLRSGPWIGCSDSPTSGLAPLRTLDGSHLTQRQGPGTYSDPRSPTRSHPCRFSDLL